MEIMERKETEKKKHGFPMRMKILLLCISISLAALILQTLLYRSTSSSLIYRQAKEENLRLLENMLTEIKSNLKSVENGLLRIYNETDFMADLRKETDIETMRETWNRLAYNVGSENFDTSLGVLALYLYTDDHEIISTYRKATTPRHNYPTDIYDGTQDTNAQVVKDYVESDETTMLITSYYNEYRKTDIARFVVKFYHNSTISKTIGYAVCDVDAKVLRYLMKKYTAGGETYVWLQPAGDRPITATGTLSGEDKDWYEQAEADIEANTDGTEEISEQENRVFFRVQMDNYNLGGYALMQQSLLKKNQNTLNRYLAIISVLMCLAAVTVSLPVSGSLTRQLERMTETMKRIRGGETRLRMTNLPGDEIGELGQTFNDMLDQIEGLIAREYEAKLATNRAEYMALQAQINPHFLYNTLDTMGSIAEIQGCGEISLLSQSLSNIFRYSLDMKNPFSTVANEMLHLKNYIYVMNVRMNHEIRYEFDVANEVLQDTLPRISVQPLVENAVNHGLRNARGEKRVCIRAFAVEQTLRIEVEDNGVGIPADKIRELLQGTPERGASIGLSNIHLRMQKMYGEAYGVTVESEEGRGTKVSLTIPRRKMEEVELWK